jgi:hypothetical protein
VVHSAQRHAVADAGRKRQHLFVQQARDQTSLLPDLRHPSLRRGTAPNGDATAAINIRCIEGIDLEAVPVQHYDGRAH